MMTIKALEGATISKAQYPNYIARSLGLKLQFKYSNNPIIFHRLQMDALSDKWHVDLAYTSCQMTQNEKQQVRPSAYGKVFMIKLVEKSQRFIKGRPQFRIQFQLNDIIKLAYWSSRIGKFQIIRSGQYKQQVLTVEQCVKKQPNPVTKQFLNPISKKDLPMTLYRFNFYNNKLEGQKSKQFYLNKVDFELFQFSLQSAFNGLTFNDSKQQYEIWKLERQIIKKQMIINKEEKQ